MTKIIAKVFLRGLLTFIPLFLTIYILVITVSWLNRVTNTALSWINPELVAFPGAGIVLAMLLLFLLGLLVSSHLTRWIVRALESPLRTLPLVKDIYGALNQLSDLFQPKGEHSTGTVVKVTPPDTEGSMVGLLMRQNFDELPKGIGETGTVAVYLPMGYQLGGFTIFVPREWVKEIDMGVESALRQTLMGWGEESRSAGS
ncbi:MAG: DUF502 domain-containing protein [Gammaproteobacteria bacterium]